MALHTVPTLSVARTFRYTLAPLSACTLEYFDGPKRQTINSDNMYIRDLGSFRASASSSCFLPRGNIFHIFSLLFPLLPVSCNNKEIYTHGVKHYLHRGQDYDQPSLTSDRRILSPPSLDRHINPCWKCCKPTLATPSATSVARSKPRTALTPNHTPEPRAQQQAQIAPRP